MQPQPQILVAFDFGPASAKALVWAAWVRRTFGGLPLHVVHILNPLPVPSIAAVPPPSPEDIHAAEEALADAVRAQGVAATTEVVLAPVAEVAILDAARRTGADLIVMGTHGRSGLARVVLGSVAEYVVRHAHCPVVTVRATDSEAQAA